MKSKISYLLMTFLSLFFSAILFTACQDESLSSYEPIQSGTAKGRPGGGPKTPPQPIADGTYTLVSKLSGKALDVANASIDEGANIHQWSATGGSNQKWTLTYNSEGYYTIVSVNSGKALTVEGGSADNGANIMQWTLNEGVDQQWQVVDLGNGYFNLVNRNSGKLLDVWEAAGFESANVAQWESNGGDNQKWAFTNGEGASANGQLKWVWTSIAGVPLDAKQRIEDAMNAAVARYNYASNWWDRTLTVEYNTGVQTADAVIGGHIRFGADVNFQNERTALHEIAHTYGVGSSWKWDSLIVNSEFIGARTKTLVQWYDGAGGGIWTGGGHFWPYGLNYNSEWSEFNAHRHCQIVSAMVKDGIY